MCFLIDGDDDDDDDDGVTVGRFGTTWWDMFHPPIGLDSGQVMFPQLFFLLFLSLENDWRFLGMFLANLNEAKSLLFEDWFSGEYHFW